MGKKWSLQWTSTTWYQINARAGVLTLHARDVRQRRYKKRLTDELLHSDFRSTGQEGNQ
jgi:hypothetical protein